jgi:hypothetical protein
VFNITHNTNIVSNLTKFRVAVPQKFDHHPLPFLQASSPLSSSILSFPVVIQRCLSLYWQAEYSPEYFKDLSSYGILLHLEVSA